MDMWGGSLEDWMDFLFQILLNKCNSGGYKADKLVTLVIGRVKLPSSQIHGDLSGLRAKR